MTTGGSGAEARHHRRRRLRHLWNLPGRSPRPRGVMSKYSARGRFLLLSVLWRPWARVVEWTLGPPRSRTRTLGTPGTSGLGSRFRRRTSRGVPPVSERSKVLPVTTPVRHGSSPQPYRRHCRSGPLRTTLSQSGGRDVGLRLVSSRRPPQSRCRPGPRNRWVPCRVVFTPL